MLIRAGECWAAFSVNPGPDSWGEEYTCIFRASGCSCTHRCKPGSGNQRGVLRILKGDVVSIRSLGWFCPTVWVGIDLLLWIMRGGDQVALIGRCVMRVCFKITGLKAF